MSEKYLIAPVPFKVVGPDGALISFPAGVTTNPPEWLEGHWYLGAVGASVTDKRPTSADAAPKSTGPDPETMQKLAAENTRLGESVTKMGEEIQLAQAARDESQAALEATQSRIVELEQKLTASDAEVAQLKAAAAKPAEPPKK